RRLLDGDEIKDVVSRSDLNAIQSELRVVAGNVREITDALKLSLVGTGGGQAPMAAIVRQVQEATAAVNQIAQGVSRMVEANDQNVNQIRTNVNELSKKLNDIADSVAGVIGRNEGDMKQSVATLRESLEKARDSLENIKSITRKVDQGEGTVG